MFGRDPDGGWIFHSDCGSFERVQCGWRNVAQLLDDRAKACSLARQHDAYGNPLRVAGSAIPLPLADGVKEAEKLAASRLLLVYHEIDGVVGTEDRSRQILAEAEVFATSGRRKPPGLAD